MGTGPHLCFLHGFCEDSRIWEPLVTELSQDYTCIAIDLPGFGASKHTPFTTIPEVTLQIRDLLHHEGIVQPILFGHSLGGYIAAEYIHQFGDETAAVAFIHSTTYADNDAKKENRLRSIAFIEKHGTAEFFRIFVPGLVALPHRARLRDDLIAMVNDAPTTSVVAGLRAMRAREDRRESLSAYHKPVLMLRGEEDQYYQAKDIYMQASLCSATQISSIPNVGHLSMLEDQKKCLTEVKHFLAFVDAIN